MYAHFYNGTSYTNNSNISCIWCSCRGARYSIEMADTNIGDNICCRRSTSSTRSFAVRGRDVTLRHAQKMGLLQLGRLLEHPHLVFLGRAACSGKLVLAMTDYFLIARYTLSSRPCGKGA